MKLFYLVLILLFLTVGCADRPNQDISKNINLKFGNPSRADRHNFNNYLMEKPQYALSYNCDRGIPNWVSWQLNKSWLGEVDRSNDFRPDPEVPTDCYAVRPNDYRGTGYDRGHMTPAADRSRNPQNNSATFLMTNIIPQTAANNREVWRELEEYCRKLVKNGRELYIIAGGDGVEEKIAKSQIVAPAYTWKVILILDRSGAEVNEKSLTIAVRIPNIDGIETTHWQDYLLPVDKLEKITGYNFFSRLPKPIQAKIESQVYVSTAVVDSPAKRSS